MKKFIALMLILSLVSVAHATTTTIEGRLNVVVQLMSSGVSTLGGPVSVYRVYLNGISPADTVAAVDVNFSTNCYQVGYYNSSPALRVTTPDMYMAQYLTKVGIDSHFLLNANWDGTAGPGNGGAWNAGSGIASETNSWAYGPKTPNGMECEGLGGLGVTAFITVGQTMQNLAFAQIVYQDALAQTPPTLTGAVSNGAGHVFNLGTIPITDVIPEPATMAMVLLGGIGILARKRRS